MPRNPASRGGGASRLPARRRRRLPAKAGMRPGGLAAGRGRYQLALLAGECQSAAGPGPVTPSTRRLPTFTAMLDCLQTTLQKISVRIRLVWRPGREK